MGKARILAVDDPARGRALEAWLAPEGYAVETVAHADDLDARLAAKPWELLLVDLELPAGDDGRAWLERVREQHPKLELLVVTPAGAPAEPAASAQLHKPLERTSLLRSVERVLEQRRLREEHARLLAENLEFMGSLSRWERAAALLSTESLQPLAERIAEALCLETGAQQAAVWVREDETVLHLATLAGGARIEEEEHELRLDALPAALARLDSDAAAGGAWCDEKDARLQLPLVHDDRLVALARLTGKVEGGSFTTRDREVADEVARFAGPAVAHALRVRALGRRAFRDDATDAYSAAFFDEALRAEIRKASRFGRSLSLLRIETRPAPGDRVPRKAPAQAAVAQQLASLLRGTDLLALDATGTFVVLLPETDAFGAASLKRRIRQALRGHADADELEAPEQPLAMGAVSYPLDGTQVETLRQRLAARTEHDRRSPLWRHLVAARSPAEMLATLAAQGQPVAPRLAEQVARLALREVARRPKERGVLFVAPGAASEVIQVELEGLRGISPRTEVIWVANTAPAAGLPASWVPPARVGSDAPFLVYLGEGPAYAMVQPASAREPVLFQSGDRSLVEHLVFELVRECGVRLHG